MKLLHIILTVAAFALLFAGCDSSGAGGGGGGGDNGGGGGDSGTVTYEIGDTGPAGGLIFYIDTADEHTWTYLEVAPTSTDWMNKQWGDSERIGGDAALTGIGDGPAATDAIVAHMDGEGITDTAAQLCNGLEHDHEGTTYGDWFLPSKDEVNAIWDNIVDDGNGDNSGVGGFAENNYWSSSELFKDFAWAQHFFSGNQSQLKKTNDERVRAVRAF